MQEFTHLLYLVCNDPLNPALYWYAVAGAISFVVAHLVITYRDEGKVSLLHLLLGGAGCFIPLINLVASAFGLVLLVVGLGCWLDSIVVLRKDGD